VGGLHLGNLFLATVDSAIDSIQLRNKSTTQVPVDSFASLDSSRVIFHVGLEKRVVEIGYSSLTESKSMTRLITTLVYI
jgi:hypothetical protein